VSADMLGPEVLSCEAALGPRYHVREKFFFWYQAPVVIGDAMSVTIWGLVNGYLPVPGNDELDCREASYLCEM
jgi:hypothetical protein